MANLYPVYGVLSIAGIAKAASGTAYLYKTGTSVQANVYGDEAGASVVTQPIALDAAGRSPTPVYTNDPIRLVLYDSTGVLVFDSDEANTGAETLVRLNNPAAASDPTLAKFITKILASMGGIDAQYRATAAATAYPVKDRLSVRISLSDFHPSADGSTSDNAAFDAANAYLTSQGGGTLVIPGKTYAISSRIASIGSNTRYEGVGPASIIKNLSASEDAIRVTDVTRIGFENFYITAASGSTGVGISVRSCSHVRFVRLVIDKHATGIKLDDHNNGVPTDACNDISIVDPDITYIGGAANGGIVYPGTNVTATGLRIIGGVVESDGGGGGNGASVILGADPANTGVRNIMIIGTTMGVGAYGVRVLGGGSTLVDGLTVLGCDMSGCISQGIKIDDTASGVVNFVELGNRPPTGGFGDSSTSTGHTHVWGSVANAKRPWGNGGARSTVTDSISLDVPGGGPVGANWTPDLARGNCHHCILTLTGAGAGTPTLTIKAPTHNPASSMADFTGMHGAMLYIFLELQAKSGAGTPVYVFESGVTNGFGVGSNNGTAGEAGPLAAGTITGYCFTWDAVRGRWRQVSKGYPSTNT